MRSFSKPIAWLCLLLIVGSTWAAAVHKHADEANAASCQVCIAAHSSAPTTALSTPKPVFQRLLAVAAQISDAKQRFLAFALFIRPPPIA
jgi:hypothetical protein